MGIKSLTVADIEEQGPRGPVWVLNSAASSKYDITGELIMSIPGVNGGDPQPLKVLETWLPQDAAARFGRERLLQSSEFRTAVQNGVVTIITPDQAKSILAKAGAREEQARIDDLERHVRRAGAARTISQSNVDMFIPDENGRPQREDDDDGTLKVDVFGPEEDNVAKLAAAGVSDTDEGFKPSFMMFFDKCNNLSDIEALNAMRTRGKFAPKELRYLRDNLKRHPQTTTAIRQRLAALKKERQAA
jgi:hypothetical protein